MSFLSKIKPARTAAMEAEIVSDLDAIVVKPVSILWQGHAHVLKPISTKEFLLATEAMAKMDALSKQGTGVKMEELVDVYAGVIGSVCDTIGKRELMQMSQAQVGALLQTVVDHVTGRIHAPEKKSPVTPKAG